MIGHVPNTTQFVLFIQNNRFEATLQHCTQALQPAALHNSIMHTNRLSKKYPSE